ncbi:armadillo-type protein [Mycena rosella]|uniref:Armadillo-type protein n=1 Tax=Mycena rosella TaxID=1033263 RepID=A0AAD7D2Y3_MYCRO|nr:armadillo-type protein [Mycena rosella]
MADPSPMDPPHRGSLESWWSDRNHQPSSTIPLHALSKPLMGALYHLAASRRLKRVRSCSPLSKEILDVLATYLHYKYVASYTKLKILNDLHRRVASSEVDARALVDNGILLHALELLRSPDPNVLEKTMVMFNHIAYYDCCIEKVIEHKSCPRVVSLLCPEHPILIQELAASTLARISGCSTRGARAVVAAGFLSHVAEMMESGNHILQSAACWMIGRLSRDRSLCDHVASLAPFGLIVSLLEGSSPAIDVTRKGYLAVLSETFLRGTHLVRQNTVCALAEISSVSFGGARAVVDANALLHVTELLMSESTAVLTNTCLMLGHLATHQSLRLLMALDGTTMRQFEPRHFMLSIASRKGWRTFPVQEWIQISPAELPIRPIF